PGPDLRPEPEGRQRLRPGAPAAAAGPRGAGEGQQDAGRDPAPGQDRQPVRSDGRPARSGRGPLPPAVDRGSVEGRPGGLRAEDVRGQGREHELRAEAQRLQGLDQPAFPADSPDGWLGRSCADRLRGSFGGAVRGALTYWNVPAWICAASVFIHDTIVGSRRWSTL